MSNLGEWEYELGAVCCSPGAMMAIDETPSQASTGHGSSCGLLVEFREGKRVGSVAESQED